MLQDKCSFLNQSKPSRCAFVCACMFALLYGNVCICVYACAMGTIWAVCVCEGDVKRKSGLGSKFSLFFIFSCATANTWGPHLSSRKKCTMVAA